MNGQTERNLSADLRDYLAEERTFLAWIRTGIAFIGSGLLVARFGIFCDPRAVPQRFALQPQELSLLAGISMIAVGVAVNLFSARRYIRLVDQLNRGQIVQRSASKQGVAVAMFLALLGATMIAYMTLSLTQLPETLLPQTASMSAFIHGSR
jgi:putative membrane protein